MSRLQHANLCIDQLGRHLGLSGLALDEQGSLSLEVDGVPVSIRHEPQPVEALWLIVDLGEVPAHSTESPRRGRLESLLEFGFQSWVGNVMTVGLGPEGDRAHGFSCVPVVNLAEGVLVDQVETMVAVAGRLESGWT